MSELQVRLADPQAQLITEIADPATTIKSLTLTYAFALLDQDAVEWPVVNRAIIERWSASALDRVKKNAWRMVRDRQRERRTG